MKGRMTRRLLGVTLAMMLMGGCGMIECKLEQMHCTDQCGDGLLALGCEKVCDFVYEQCLRSGPRPR